MDDEYEELDWVEVWYDEASDVHEVGLLHHPPPLQRYLHFTTQELWDLADGLKNYLELGGFMDDEEGVSDEDFAKYRRKLKRQYVRK